MSASSATASPANLRATARHIGVTLSRQWTATLLQFGLVLIVARSLGNDGLGTYTVAILIPTLLSQFLNLGLASANVYFIASGRTAIEDAWGASRWCVGVMSVLGTIAAAFLISFFGGSLFPGVTQACLLSAVLLFPCMLTTSIVLSFFQAVRDFRAYNHALLIQPGIAVAGATALAFTNRATLESILAAIFVSHMVAMAYALLLLRRHVAVPLTTSLPKKHILHALRYGGTAHLGNVLALLTYRLDILLVNLFAGQAAAGIYAVAVRLTENVGALSQASSTVLFPTLAAMATQSSAQRHLANAMARGVVIVTLIMAIAVGLVAKPLVSVLFGESFTSAVPAFLILLPGIVALSGSRVLANETAARGRPAINLRLAAITLIVNTVGNVILIPQHGIYGAATASTVAYSMDLLMRVFLLFLSRERLAGRTDR